VELFLIALIVFEVLSGGFATANVAGAVAGASSAAWGVAKESANSWYSTRAKELEKTRWGRFRLRQEKRAAVTGAFLGRGLVAGAKAAPRGAKKGRQVWSAKSPVARGWRKWRTPNGGATGAPDGGSPDAPDAATTGRIELAPAPQSAPSTEPTPDAKSAFDHAEARRQMLDAARSRTGQTDQSPVPGGGESKGEHVANTDTEKAPAVLQAWRRLASEVAAQVEADDTNGWALPGDQDAAEAVKAVLTAKEADLGSIVEGAEGTKNARAEAFRE
jgi:hypothetical protein